MKRDSDEMISAICGLLAIITAILGIFTYIVGHEDAERILMLSAITVIGWKAFKPKN